MILKHLAMAAILLIYWIQVRHAAAAVEISLCTRLLKTDQYFFSNLVHMLRVPKGKSLF